MKKLWLLLAALPLLMTGAETKNLLRNGDFSKKMAGWVTKNKTISIVEKAGPNGENALKAVSQKEIYIANYTVRTKPNTDYTLRGWIKSNGKANVYLYFTHSGGKFHSQSYTLNSPTDWTRVHALLNSKNSKGIAVLLRVVGKHPTTAHFAGLEVLEGNHIPRENLVANSDFSIRTRYAQIPDRWTPGLYVSIADPTDYNFELVKDVKPPVKGAGVMRVRRAIMAGQLLQQTVAGQDYTFSFYAKNSEKGKPAKISYHLGKNRKDVILTDEWKRYSITGTANSGHSGGRILPRDFRNKYTGAYLISAPQLIMGKAPVEWTKPVAKKSLAVHAIKEAAARADSRLISGKPTAAMWSNAPTYELIHNSRGPAAGRVYAHVQLLHNKTHLFALYTCKKDPAIKVGDTTRLNWSSLCDTTELFLTDRASDGNYIHAAVNINGHTYSAMNQRPELLGVKTKVTNGKNEWSALYEVPLSLFHTNKEWKIAFGRGFDHKQHGRVAMDWSIPGSRHKPENFGQLYGVCVEKRAVLDLTKLYAGLNNDQIVYEFSSVTPDVKGATLTASLQLRGKTLWKKVMPFNAAKGIIPLPADHQKMMETETRLSLKVTKNGKDLFMGSRVFYLLFSSYAKYNKDMELFPKYNIFTPADKFVTLKSKLNKAVFDRLEYEIRDSKGKVAAKGTALPTTRIPVSKFAPGSYRIWATAFKKGKKAEARNFFTFRVLPDFKHMVRIDHEQRNLETPVKPLLPMAYYSTASVGYPYDPLYSTMPPKFFEGLKKANYEAIKTGGAFIRNHFDSTIAQCEKNDVRLLMDLEFCYPRNFYSNQPASVKMTGKQAEDIFIPYTQNIISKFAGKPGVLAYAPYHEPGYYRNGKGIIDSYRVSMILDDLRKTDPYRPITGFWAPPHWDANGEPFGGVDGVDFFIVDIYTRNLEKHCDELFRISHASRIARRPIGQIFNIDNLGSDEREAPTGPEYRNEVYTALIAGYRVFYNYVGIPADKALWKEMQNTNKHLKVFTKYLCSNACQERTSVNGEKAAYAVYDIGKEVLVIAVSKSNDKKVSLTIDLEKIAGASLKNGKELFGGKKIALQGGLLKTTFPAAGCNAWIFTK